MRAYSEKLLQMIDGGVVSKDYIITSLIRYLSESEVKEYMELNALIEEEGEEEE